MCKINFVSVAPSVDGQETTHCSNSNLIHPYICPHTHFPIKVHFHAQNYDESQNEFSAVNIPGKSLFKWQIVLPTSCANRNYVHFDTKWQSLWAHLLNKKHN